MEQSNSQTKYSIKSSNKTFKVVTLSMLCGTETGVHLVHTNSIWLNFNWWLIPFTGK